MKTSLPWIVAFSAIREKEREESEKLEKQERKKEKGREEEKESSRLGRKKKVDQACIFGHSKSISSVFLAISR